MMKPLMTSVALALAIAGPTLASAAIVEYRFEGVIAGIDDPLQGAVFTVGDPVSGSVFLDTTDERPADLTLGLYRTSDFVLDIGPSYSITGTQNGMSVFNNWGGSLDGVNFGFAGPTLAGSAVNGHSPDYFSMSNTGHVTYENDALPLSFSGGTEPGTYASLRFDGDDNMLVHSSLTAASTVPLPAPLVLLLSGLSVLGFAGWRKQRRTLPCKDSL